MIKLTVDGKEVQAKEGVSILHACLESGIYVPNLCFLKEMEHPTGACRMCLVEIEGEKKPLASCEVKVREGMLVRTDTEQVKALQRTMINLLFSAHHMDCKNCSCKKTCELQRIAKHVGVKVKARKRDEIRRDVSRLPEHPYLNVNAEKCIMCRKCIYVCRTTHGESRLASYGKGFDAAIGYAGEKAPADATCTECKVCEVICPVNAINRKGEEKKPEAAAAKE